MMRARQQMPKQGTRMTDNLGEIISGFTPPPHPKGISLQGAHILIEPLDDAKHGAQLFAAKQRDVSGDNWTYLPYGPFADEVAYRTWLRAQQEGDDPCFFAMIDPATQQAVGIASFLRIDQANGVIEVGHIHFSPLLQRTTASTEALFLMMQWAFEQGYRRYEWKCNALNVPSRRAAQRLGLSYEGIFRQMMISKGRNRDTAWFAAIDKEWPALQQAFLTFLSADNFTSDGVAIQSLSSLTAPLLYQRDH